MVEIQLEAACSFTSAMFEIFANLILATAFKKVIATEQKLPNVSTAKGTIVEYHYHIIIYNIISYDIIYIYDIKENNTFVSRI